MYKYQMWPKEGGNGGKRDDAVNRTSERDGDNGNERNEGRGRGGKTEIRETEERQRETGSGSMTSCRGACSGLSNWSVRSGRQGTVESASRQECSVNPRWGILRSTLLPFEHSEVTASRDVVQCASVTVLVTMRVSLDKRATFSDATTDMFRFVIDIKKIIYWSDCDATSISET